MDDIYPHLLLTFRAIHRETKHQCILINLCFRLIVADRAMNPYRFCSMFICRTFCTFWGTIFCCTHLRFRLLRTQCTHILIYASTEDRTARHDAPWPPPHWRRARYRGAALHLDDGAAFLPLQQISGSGDLSISESMIGCNQDTCQVAKLNAYPGGKIRSRSWPRWPGRRTPRRQWPGSWPEWLPGCWIPDRKSRCSRSAVRGR